MVSSPIIALRFFFFFYIEYLSQFLEYIPNKRLYNEEGKKRRRSAIQIDINLKVVELN